MSSMPSLQSSPSIIADSVRRFVDATVSAIGLVALSPLFIIIAVWIKWDSPGPVLYRATRVGRDGMPFHLYKFRSMVVNADKRGPAITSAGDSRVTRSGRFLRRTKLDELPQLINVIKGDMSIVGPRPEDPRYVALYSQEQRRILSVRPGITSAASLSYRHEEQLLTGDDWETLYRNQVMPDKLAIDLAYLERRTLVGDLKLIVQTIAAVFD
jgi:lipopolysaccharide/colanic/teichoic acid biosynthesis glycosyltransferase